MSDMSTMQQQSLMQQQPPQQQPQPVLSLPTMQLSQQPSAISSGVLTAAQTQYLTQLSQQSSENLKAAGQTSFASTISSQVYRCAPRNIFTCAMNFSYIDICCANACVRMCISAPKTNEATSQSSSAIQNTIERCGDAG